MKDYPLYRTDYYGTFREFVGGIAKYGEKPAISQYDRNGNKKVRSYRQLCSDVGRLTGYLVSKRMDGKRTAVAGENSYDWIVSFLAVTCAGGVAICIDTDQSDETITDCMRRADTELAIVSESVADLSDSVLGSANVIIMDGGDTGKGGHVTVSGAIGENARANDSDMRTADPDDPCAVMFTSGTVSKPKAVSLTHRSMLNNAAGAVATVDLGRTIFSGLPLFHAYGLNCALFYSLVKGSSFTLGGRMRFIIRDTFLSESATVYCVPLILEVIYRQGVENARRAGLEKKLDARLKAFSSGNIIRKKLTDGSADELRRACFGHIRMIVCGGAYVNPEVAKNMEALGVTVFQGYGITECSPLVSVSRNKKHDRDTVGVLLPGYEIRFSSEGEILLRGPSVMKEYYRDPEATAQVLSPDGWFSTGDIGEMSGDGFLKITGRLKNIIVLNNGDKISPEKIETMLLRIPMIKEARVYGAPMGVGGDNVQPAVTVYPDPEITGGMEQYEVAASLRSEIEKVNSTLPAYQQVRMINIRETPFEKTATSKIKRNDN